MLHLHGQPDDADVLERLVWGITGERPFRTPVRPPPTITNSLGMVFTLIPAGALRMGSPDGGDDECPVHHVRISQAFYLGTYAVTQGQWQAVMGTNPSHFQGDSNRPVEHVSWEEAQAFIQQLSVREGETRYRLPTEAEWEYTARWHHDGLQFGDDAAQLGQYRMVCGEPGPEHAPRGAAAAECLGAI